MDDVRELGQFYDPLAAQLEVEAVDVRGGRDEARLEVVYRQLRDLFRWARARLVTVLCSIEPYKWG